MSDEIDALYEDDDVILVKINDWVVFTGKAHLRGVESCLVTAFFYGNHIYRKSDTPVPVMADSELGRTLRKWWKSRP